MIATTIREGADAASEIRAAQLMSGGAGTTSTASTAPDRVTHKPLVLVEDEHSIGVLAQLPRARGLPRGMGVVR